MNAATTAIPLFLFMCVLLAVEDSSLPTYIRLLAGGVFGFPEEAPEKFYERYKAKRKGRVVVGLLLAISVGVARWFTMPMPMQAAAIVVAVFGYGVLIVYDMFRSRGTVKANALSPDFQVLLGRRPHECEARRPRLPGVLLED